MNINKCTGDANAEIKTITLYGCCATYYDIAT